MGRLSDVTRVTSPRARIQDPDDRLDAPDAQSLDVPNAKTLGHLMPCPMPHSLRPDAQTLVVLDAMDDTPLSDAQCSSPSVLEVSMLGPRTQSRSRASQVHELPLRPRT